MAKSSNEALLRAMYPKSTRSQPNQPAPARKERHIPSRDDEVFDRLIAEGRTPEYAEEQAKHAAFLQGVYPSHHEDKP